MRTPFEPFTPGGCHVPNTNALPPGARLRRREPRRVDRPAHRVRGPRDGVGRDPRARPERRRLLHAARGLLPARARDLRRATTCCSSPTRSSARGAAWASTSAPSATATSPTSSRRPRASRRPTRRWARSSPPTASSSRSAEGKTSFLHGITFGGHPIAAAVAHGQHRRLRARGDPRERPRATRATLRGDARLAARHRDRRRRARRRLLPRASSSSRTATPRQHFTHEQSRDAAARLPLAPRCTAAG